MSDEMMTIDELKEMLHIGNDKAYKLVKQNGFPAVRFGNGSWLIDREALKAWLAKIYATNTKSVSLFVAESEFGNIKEIMELLTPDE